MPYPSPSSQILAPSSCTARCLPSTAYSRLSTPYQRIIEPNPSLVLTGFKKRSQGNHVLGPEQSKYRSSPYLHRRRRPVGPRSDGRAGRVSWLSGNRIPCHSGLSRMASNSLHRLSDRRRNDAHDQRFRTSTIADRQRLSNSDYFYHGLR
jgi:hypothetical protein